MGVSLLMLTFREKFLTFSSFLLVVVCITFMQKGDNIKVLFRHVFYLNLNSQKMLRRATPWDSIVVV